MFRRDRGALKHVDVPAPDRLPALRPEVTAAEARFPAMRAISALAHEGGLDLLVAAELADALGFGWEVEEYELRRVNELVPGCDPVLPSWLLSTFRDDMRSEVILANYGLIPRHAMFIANTLICAPRLKRLVIHFAFLGDAGVEAIAKAVCDRALPLEDVHLCSVLMGDAGAKAVAAAMAHPACGVFFWNIESNRITDEGAEAIADAVKDSQPKDARRVSDLQIDDNFISAAGVARLRSVAKIHRVRMSSLRMRQGSPRPLSQFEAAKTEMVTLHDVEANVPKLGRRLY